MSPIKVELQGILIKATVHTIHISHMFVILLRSIRASYECYVPTQHANTHTHTHNIDILNDAPIYTNEKSLNAVVYARARKF